MYESMEAVRIPLLGTPDRSDPVFDGATCRAAGALLGVSQEELCADAGCGRQLLADLKNGIATPKSLKLADLQHALENRGAVFGQVGDLVLVPSISKSQRSPAFPT